MAAGLGQRHPPLAGQGGAAPRRGAGPGSCCSSMPANRSTWVTTARPCGVATRSGQDGHHDTARHARPAASGEGSQSPGAARGGGGRRAPPAAAARPPPGWRRAARQARGRAPATQPPRRAATQPGQPRDTPPCCPATSSPRSLFSARNVRDFTDPSGQLQHLRRLRLGQVEEVAAHQHPPLPVREPVHGRHQLGAPFRGQHLIGRAVRRRGRPLRQRTAAGPARCAAVATG